MLIADTTSLDEAFQEEMLSFKCAMNGLTTFAWKVVMPSRETSMSAVLSRFSASSNNSSTQFAAGKTVSSSASRVESTKPGMMDKSRCSDWNV